MARKILFLHIIIIPKAYQNNMEQLIQLSQTEIKLAFVASCIEGTARALGKSYQEIFERMKRVGMIRHYIWPNYEMLHTESRENVTNNMIECLKTWEAQQ